MKVDLKQRSSFTLACSLTRFKTSLFYPSGRDLWLLCNKGHACFNRYWEQNTYGDTVEPKETQ